MTLPHTLPLLAFALSTPGHAAVQTPTLHAPPRDVPLETYVVEDGSGGSLGCRVVDALSGRPIVGAELCLVLEAKAPLPGEFTFLRSAVSDAEGFVTLPLDGRRGDWLVLRAPGYGPSSSMGHVPSLVWPLAPALDVPVRMLDWLDRPVPGAGVGVCLGCGHTPDVAHARADEHGIALVRGIDPWNRPADFYPEHPALGLEDYGSITWVPGDPPALVRASYGEALRGKVLDPEGRPLAGAFVGTKSKDRGPWTATRADGSFQLDGCSPREELFVLRADQLEHEYLFERTLAEPLVLRLPVADQSPTQAVELLPPEHGRGTLKLWMQDAKGEAIARLNVQCIGPLPLQSGRTEISARDGSVTFELDAGTYELRCSDRAYAEHVGEAVVTAGETTTLTLRPTLWPSVVLDAPPECQVLLGRSGKATNVTPLVRQGEPVPIPTGETFGLAIAQEGQYRILSFTAEEALRAEPVALRFLPPTRVLARLVDAANRPVEAEVELLTRRRLLEGDGLFDVRTLRGEATRDGRIELASTEVGVQVLAVRPRRGDLRPLLLPVSLPEPGADARLELGELRLATEARLRILGADGRPYASAAPGITRLGWSDVRNPPLAFPLDENGAWLGLEPRVGDAILVPAADWDLESTGEEDATEDVIDLPFRTVLQGEGPWTLQVPPGELELDLRGPGGEPLAARVFVGDRSLALTRKTRLRQLPVGPLELTIAAPGLVPVCVTATVPQVGSGVLQLALSPR